MPGVPAAWCLVVGTVLWMSCDEKAWYPSRRLAQQSATAARGRTGGELIEPYFCVRHDGWHIGHVTASPRLAKQPRRRR